MASPSVSDQGKQSPTSNGDGDSSQDSIMDLKVKDEPVDTGYEPVAPSDNHSSSNSRASSPPSSVQRETVSPSQDPDDPQSPFTEDQQPVRSHGTSSGKKIDSVQNIVEGLLKKNASIIAMNDAKSSKSLKSKAQHDSNIKRPEASLSSSGQSTVFPVSTVSQARIVANQRNPPRNMNDSRRSKFLRPKSPTRKCNSILRDDSQLSYAVMEASVGDPEVENIFRVQHHELVCAVSVKSYIADKEKKVVAVLDNSYYWCNFCSFSSTNKELLTQHVMDHRFLCNHCQYESFCRSDILRHMAAKHSEVSSSENSLTYCTFLSDYLRVKSRAEKVEKKLPCVDPDDDVDDLDKEEMQVALLKSEKRKKEEDGEMYELSEKRARYDDDDDVTKSSESSLDRPGKSRKSQNPRRHPQPSENDYDTFEMEVEEISDYVENGKESSGDKMRVMYPSNTVDDSKESSAPIPTSMSRMQVIPSLQDGGKQSFTATHVPSPAPRTGPGRPPKNSCPFNKTKRTGSSSSLYWSCGYCDFQSNSQAEIKEHSNRNHPGNPHRFNKEPHKFKTSLNPRTKGCRESIFGIHESQAISSGSEEIESNERAKFLSVRASVKSVNNGKNDELYGNVMTDDGSESDDDDDDDDDLSRFHKGLDKAVEIEHLMESNQGVEFDSISDKDSDEIGREIDDVDEFDEYLKSPSRGLDLDINEIQVDDGTVTAEHERSSPVIAIEEETITIPNEEDSRQVLDCNEISPSHHLKLTFKTVGQITTCRIKDNESSMTTEMALQSGSPQVVHPTVQAEYAECEHDLIDSSDESDFDIDSNPRSIALSVSSISEIFENSVDSPYKELGQMESETVDENDDSAELKPERSKVCSEDVVKLSPSGWMPEGSSEKVVGLTCVPARSAAVKAMTRMKPSVEEGETESSGDKHSGVVKKITSKSKMNLGKACRPMFQEPISKTPSKSSIKSVYSCHHCTNMKGVMLPIIKSHMVNQHKQQPPTVTNVRYQGNGMKRRKVYLCLIHSCRKQFKNSAELDCHKTEDHSISFPAAQRKERKTMNSLSTSSVSSISQVFSPPKMLPVARESVSDCCVKLHQLDMSQLSRYHVTPAPPEKSQVDRYECLYCTENFSCSTLPGIKQHHFSEHSSQLLVMRDMEAKKSQLPSRIYLCDDSSCDFKSSCRSEILTHSSCHSANSTCVYECPSCGWFSSSFRVAEDHVKDVHADEGNISLIRMQLSVDENGQTSKRILR